MHRGPNGFALPSRHVEGVDDQLLDRFGSETEPPDLSGWEALVKRGD